MLKRDQELSTWRLANLLLEVCRAQSLADAELYMLRNKYKRVVADYQHILSPHFLGNWQLHFANEFLGDALQRADHPRKLALAEFFLRLAWAKEPIDVVHAVRDHLGRADGDRLVQHIAPILFAGLPKTGSSTSVS